MARWKLMTGHYLNVPGTEWEYNETSRSSGKAQRVRFPVPAYLDPKDPSSWTERWGERSQFNDGQDGIVVVCQPGKGNPSDVVFIGDPTPDMVPIDEEAEAISASFKTHWAYKPESSEGNFSQALVDRFQTEMADLRSNVKPQQVEIPGLAELAAALSASVKQNEALIARLAEQPSRRI